MTCQNVVAQNSRGCSRSMYVTRNKQGVVSIVLLLFRNVDVVVNKVLEHDNGMEPKYKMTRAS